MRRELSRLFFIMEFSGVGGLGSEPVKPPTKPVISTGIRQPHSPVISTGIRQPHSPVISTGSASWRRSGEIYS